MKSLTKQIPKWIQFRSVGYLTGRGIHYGSADGKIFPRRACKPGVYSIGVDPRTGDDVDVCSIDFNGLEDKFYDWAFIGPQFKAHPNPEALIRQSVKKLKPQGHLILAVPKDVNYFKYLSGYSWLKKDSQHRDDFHFIALRKFAGKKGVQLGPNTRGDCDSGRCKRACIVRYGALGDQVVISPLAKRLHEDGYHVTINSHTDTGIVLRGSPFVDNIVGQERDAIFNPDLKDYWEEWAGEYDRYINLSESVEGSLLKVQGFRDYYTPKEWRHKVCNVNYYDRTMALGGYPEETGTRPTLCFTDKEEKRTDKFVADLRGSGGNRLVLWLLKGSSFHKKYPLAPIVVNELLRQHPNLVVLISGGKDAKDLWFDHPSGRVIDLIDKFPPRDIMCLTSKVDVVIGPETGMMNAAAAFDTKKIVFLSHSSEENLTKYWTNTINILPPKDVVPCFPCHQMHYDKDSCPLAEIKQNNRSIGFEPVCCVSVPPEQVIETINQAL